MEVGFFLIQWRMTICRLSLAVNDNNFLLLDDALTVCIVLLYFLTWDITANINILQLCYHAWFSGYDDYALVHCHSHTLTEVEAN